MTRKRFVKLLMSKGNSRNEAQRKANHFNSCHIPYEKAIKLAYLCSAMVKVSNVATKAAKSIGAFMGAVKFISRSETE